jgi:hypothetical protein
MSLRIIVTKVEEALGGPSPAYHFLLENVARDGFDRSVILHLYEIGKMATSTSVDRLIVLRVGESLQANLDFRVLGDDDRLFEGAWTFATK